MHTDTLQHFQRRFTVSDRCLGSGMYSKVYLAYDAKKGDQVACKVVDLRQSSSDNPEESTLTHKADQKRLIQEVKLLAKLDHVRNNLFTHPT